LFIYLFIYLLYLFIYLFYLFIYLSAITLLCLQTAMYYILKLDFKVKTAEFTILPEKYSNISNNYVYNIARIFA